MGEGIRRLDPIKKKNHIPVYIREERARQRAGLAVISGASGGMGRDQRRTCGAREMKPRRDQKSGEERTAEAGQIFTNKADFLRFFLLICPEKSP